MQCSSPSSSNLPEELGRIDYLLSDKTGTLTKNEMQLKKLHLGGLSFSKDDLSDLRKYLLWGFTEKADQYSQGSGLVSKETLLSTSGSSTAHVQSLRHIQVCYSILFSDMRRCSNALFFLDRRWYIKPC